MGLFPGNGSLRYLFEEFALDTERRELHRGQDVVAIAPQVFDLLDYLICNRERVVSKDDLISAIWNGRIVSDAALTTRLNIVRSVIGDTGHQQRLIKTLPRKGFRFVGPVREMLQPPGGAVADDPDEPSKAALALPDKPSIAVLPFQNMSGDPEQEYFADGMAEDILTGLSRHRWLFVIARNSSFTYKGRAVDVRQVGRELGVRYVLEGSVRRAGSRVRFTAQLVDTATGNHVWGEKYDGQAEDLFDLQDRITEAVVGILEPTIQLAEIERTRRKRPENLGAYDYYLRALALTDTFTHDSIQAMRNNCLQAIALDPTFAPAYALAARTYIQTHTQGWTVDEPRERAEVLDLVERGLRADRLDPLMLGTAGHCFAWFAHDLAKGIAYIDEALSVNPNHAHAYLQSGVVRVRAGDTEVAIRHLNHARRLSPRDSRGYAIFQTLALAHYLGGNLEMACDWANRAVQHNPNYLPGWVVLASSAASMGRDAEAKVAAQTLLKLDPQLSVSRLVRRYPVAIRDKFETYYQGLRRAGVPD
jgi:TolB-like protein